MYAVDQKGADDQRKRKEQARVHLGSYLDNSLLAWLNLLPNVHDSVVTRETLDVVRRHVAQKRRFTHAVSPDEAVLTDEQYVRAAKCKQITHATIVHCINVAIPGSASSAHSVISGKQDSATAHS